MIKSTSKISQNSFSCYKVYVSGGIHELAHLMNNKGEIKACESEIVQSTNQTSIGMNINERGAFSCRETNMRNTRCFARAAVLHIVFVQLISRILVCVRDKPAEDRWICKPRKKLRVPKSLSSKTLLRLVINWDRNVALLPVRTMSST